MAMNQEIYGKKFNKKGKQCSQFSQEGVQIKALQRSYLTLNKPHLSLSINHAEAEIEMCFKKKIDELQSSYGTNIP